MVGMVQNSKNIFQKKANSIEKIKIHSQKYFLARLLYKSILGLLLPFVNIL
jgi:hypothetical protein